MKCFICDEVTDENQDVVSLSGKSAHDTCQSDSSEYASSLFEFLPDGDVNKTIFDNDFIYESDQDNYDSLPYPVKAEKWVNSDGWRGYTDWEFEKGLISMGDGWVTGWADETTGRKAELGEIFEKLNAGKITPPCIIYWLFGHTSNVFSTASEVLVKKADLKKFEKCLRNKKLWQNLILKTSSLTLLLKVQKITQELLNLNLVVLRLHGLIQIKKN